MLATLLNNLKVQERQNRVCTTVAIAIVAETCSPFTVLPALMNEYRVPELNVQNGVLKSLSFMFEYIGEMGKDYIYSIAPLFEDALMDRLVLFIFIPNTLSYQRIMKENHQRCVLVKNQISSSGHFFVKKLPSIKLL